MNMFTRDRNYSDAHLDAEALQEAELEAYRAGAAAERDRLQLGFFTPTAEQEMAIEEAGRRAVAVLARPATKAIPAAIQAEIDRINAERGF